MAFMTASSLLWVRSFWLIATVGWRVSYVIYGACMTVGMIATWFAREPERADAVMDEKQRDTPLWTWRGFFDAVVGPFIAFFAPMAGSRW
jgi:MFS transporter, PAT family, beta-lactamase induction signal transducer AmpG